jgi:hypothetical protein
VATTRQGAYWGVVVAWPRGVVEPPELPVLPGDGALSCCWLSLRSICVRQWSTWAWSRSRGRTLPPQMGHSPSGSSYAAADKDVEDAEGYIGGLGVRGDLLPGPSILVVELQTTWFGYSPFSVVI